MNNKRKKNQDERCEMAENLKGWKSRINDQMILILRTQKATRDEISFLGYPVKGFIKQGREPGVGGKEGRG
jgi:hypothetical protein